MSYSLSDLSAATFFYVGKPLLFAILVFFATFIYFICSSRSRSDDNKEAKSSSQASTLHEAEDDNGRPSNRVSVGLSRPTKHDGSSHGWIQDARKIYRKFLGKRRDRLGVDPDDASNNNSNHCRAPLRRRHSVSSSLQLARVAKDFFIRGRGTFLRPRPKTEVHRASLPRPPTEFFEPSENPSLPPHLKPEVFYILQNLKMLELPTDWYLDHSDITLQPYKKDDYILRPGDEDSSILVVLEGVISVHIVHGEGKEKMVRKISKGDSFLSLLSLLEHLQSKDLRFRTISVRAFTDCSIACYPLHKFRDWYIKNPRPWVRPIQIVMTRLLHVTLTTLHEYLGLSVELLRRRADEKRMLTDDRHRYIPAALNVMKSHSKIKSRRRHPSSSDESNEQQTVAAKMFADALGLGTSPESIELIQTRIDIVTIAENIIFIEENSEEEKLYLVVNGCAEIFQTHPLEDDQGEDDLKVLVHPRELIGGLQLLTSEPAFYSSRSYTQVTLAVMDKQSFSELLDRRPEIILPVALSVTHRLSSFVTTVDFAIDWVLLESGQAVYRIGDEADSIFTVLSGRLRSVDNKVVIEEFGRGDMLGMIEVLQGTPRKTTVLATRFSQLARIPEGLLNFVKMQFPQVGFRLVKLLGHYYSSSSRQILNNSSTFSDRFLSSAGDPLSHIKNLHTLAILATSPEVPIIAFACELYHALNVNLRVLRLSSNKVAEHLGPSVLEREADFRLMHWLNVQEDTFPLVLYVCDPVITNWTRICLRQADAILVVGNGEQKPVKQSFIDDFLLASQGGVRTNKELILLWNKNVTAPHGTYEWLKGSWFSGHHHIRMPDRMNKWNATQVMEREVVDFYEENVFWDRVNLYSDFSRLARILTGNSIGLVLGGGGARGASHVGVIRAIEECGIPIDCVGGVSIGALIGGMYADSTQDLEERARNWFELMSSVWRKVLDLTYNYSAMFTGAGFNETVRSAFGDILIEDLWLPYFCISTDISNSEMRVHRSGSLWQYVRASMSLAGYLPPLCDPEDGHLLLDGGYVNNLPADVMRALGAKKVIAVDVGAATNRNLSNYGNSLNGFWVLFNRLNPWAEPLNVPDMEEIQSRLAYVSSVRHLESIKTAPYCHYVRPPIENFKTLDFLLFETIYDVGYKYGQDSIREILKNDPEILRDIDSDKLHNVTTEALRRESKILLANRSDRTEASSFTELAAQLSKIPRRQTSQSIDEMEGMHATDEEILEGLVDELDVPPSPDVFSEGDSIDGYCSEPCGYLERSECISHELMIVDEDDDNLGVSSVSSTLNRRDTITEGLYREHPKQYGHYVLRSSSLTVGDVLNRASERPLDVQPHPFALNLPVDVYRKPSDERGRRSSLISAASRSFSSSSIRSELNNQVKFELSSEQPKTL